MPEAIKAVILAIVQGITEFLPVSSSAHLLALEEALDFHLEGVAFDVSVHLATLLAVLLYFRGEIIDIVRTGKSWPVLARVALATVPVVAVGFLLKSFRENISPWFAVGGWTFSGIYLLLTRGRAGSQRYADISLVRALGIGAAESISILPGVSRSGSTIAAGLWLGLTREDAARFSFLLAIPAILGAGLLEGMKLSKPHEISGDLWLLCAIAMPVSFVVGLLAIHVLLKAVRSNLFSSFGWYNLAAAAVFCTYLAVRR